MSPRPRACRNKAREALPPLQAVRRRAAGWIARSRRLARIAAAGKLRVGCPDIKRRRRDAESGGTFGFEALQGKPRHRVGLGLGGRIGEAALETVQHLFEKRRAGADQQQLQARQMQTRIGDRDQRRFGERRVQYTPRVVTLWYRAPELLFGAKFYGSPVDLWSVG